MAPRLLKRSLSRLYYCCCCCCCCFRRVFNSVYVHSCDDDATVTKDQMVAGHLGVKTPGDAATPFPSQTHENLYSSNSETASKCLSDTRGSWKKSPAFKCMSSGNPGSRSIDCAHFSMQQDQMQICRQTSRQSSEHNEKFVNTSKNSTIRATAVVDEERGYLNRGEQDVKRPQDPSSPSRRKYRKFVQKPTREDQEHESTVETSIEDEKVVS